MISPMVTVAVALLVLAACGDDNSYSPTAPPTPAPPPPAPVPSGSSVTANYTLGVYTEGGSGVEEVQVFIDGGIICTGNLQGYWDYDGLCNSGDLGTLAAGRHTLTVKVTRQAVSPTRYDVSNRVEVVLKVDGVTVDSQRASWEESVTLATGDAWTGVFEIRAWRG